jgi:release factor glutamine methyltransferase
VPYEPEVAAYEPKHAVFTPPGDPLFYYRKMFMDAGALLGPGGLLIMELGAAHRHAVDALAHELGWRNTAIRKDLSGIDRVMGFMPARNPKG